MQKPMEYLTPNQISAKLWISLRKVYYVLQNNKDSIQTIKQWKKRLISFLQFEKVCAIKQKTLQDVMQKNNQIPVKEEVQTKSETEFFKLQKAYSNLQKEQNYLHEQTNNLTKHNNTLQTQVQKYALLLSDEKSEKKQIIEKYDELNRMHIDKIENFGKERVRLNRLVFFLLSVCLIFAIIIAIRYNYTIGILW